MKDSFQCLPHSLLLKFGVEGQNEVQMGPLGSSGSCSGGPQYSGSSGDCNEVRESTRK